MRYAESSWRTEEEFKLFAEMTLAMYEKYAPLARTDKSTYYSDYSIDALLLSRYNLQGHLSDDAFYGTTAAGRGQTATGSRGITSITHAVTDSL